MIFPHIVFVSVKDKVIAAGVSIPGVDRTTDISLDLSRKGDSIASVDAFDVKGLCLSAIVRTSG